VATLLAITAAEKLALWKVMPFAEKLLAVQPLSVLSKAPSVIKTPAPSYSAG